MPMIFQMRELPICISFTWNPKCQI